MSRTVTTLLVVRHGQERERERTRALLEEVQVRALMLEEESPSILLVSHGGLMKELYNILVAQTGEKNALKTQPPNTGIDQYSKHHRKMFGNLRYQEVVFGSL